MSHQILIRFVLVTLLLAQSIAYAANVDDPNFSSEEARNFSATGTAQPNRPASPMAAKMSLAQVPDEFDCPLFSNSPFTDILNAIDGLQTAINLFPKCDANSTAATDVMTATSSELRQKVIEAKSLQDSGQTRKLGVSAEKILSTANRMQDLLIRTSTSSKGECYKSEDSKKLIFSMNDTFQSIAPVALEIVAKNPTLASTLAPYLPMVAGAQAISKGISVLELALQQAPTLDMTVPENRIAIIKNTCAFMKVYNRLEYLTLDRASRLAKINKDFDEKIRDSQAVRIKMVSSLGSLALSSNPKDEAVNRIKDQLAKSVKIIGQATDELVVQDGKAASVIGICSVIKTVRSLKVAEKVLGDLNELAALLEREDVVAFKKTKLEEFNNETKKPAFVEDANVCASIGVEWLESQKEAVDEIKKLLEVYDASTQRGGSSVQEIKIAREDKKTANLQSNKRKLNLFTDLSMFEPGEVAKRMRDLPKYLFNGPDGSLWSRVKKNGPVYDLIQNNEKSFEMALERFQKQVQYFKAFENQFLRAEYKEKIPVQPEQSKVYFEKMRVYEEKLPHVSVQYAQFGSRQHRELCDRSKLAIKAYVELTDHLISNEYLCKMIDPALKEPVVSIWLKRYCQNARGFVTNVDVKAGFKELARPLFVKNGPKTQIEMIMQKYDNLSCE